MHHVSHLALWLLTVSKAALLALTQDVMVWMCAHLHKQHAGPPRKSCHVTQHIILELKSRYERRNYQLEAVPCLEYGVLDCVSRFKLQHNARGALHALWERKAFASEVLGLCLARLGQLWLHSYLPSKGSSAEANQACRCKMLS